MTVYVIYYIIYTVLFSFLWILLWISSHHPLWLRAGCWTTGQHTTCELPQVIMMPQCHGPKQHTEPDRLVRLSSRHLKARHFYESSHVSCINKTGVGTGRSFESSWIHLSHFKSLSIFHPFPYSYPFFFQSPDDTWSIMKPKSCQVDWTIRSSSDQET